MKRRITIFIPVVFIVTAVVIIQLWILLSGSVEQITVTILSLISIFLILIGGLLFFIYLFIPVNRLAGKLLSLHKGSVPRIETGSMNNEIGDIEKALKEHFTYLEEVIQFTLDISQGKIKDSFEVRGEEDRIGQAMLQLKDRLNRTKMEDELRRSRDEQQNWAAQGLATIGELLRNTEDDINIMSNEFIRELVKYVDMEVGGFFLVRNEEGAEPELELSGSYAFDREKQVEKRFKFGEGLVGRCAVEKDSIVITDIPTDYIKIRSGMGEDYPSTLILVPVLLDEQVLGVIELASFSEVPEYKINFIKSLSNSIAASVTKVQVNISTAKLLKQSRQQSEELFSREEEMRQSMEELRSTQEQSAKREEQLLKEVEKLKEQLKRE